MPWSMTNLPDVAKNKPEKQQEAFISSANNALERGLTEEEAIFAGIGAMRVVAKKNATVSKASYSAKEPLKRPSHIPDPVLIKAFQQQEAQEILKAEMDKLISVPSYLGKSLPQGTQRNVIAANFDSQDRYVILFDTGEQLISRSMDIKQYVEQYVTISGKSGGGSSAPSGDILYNEYPLSGFSTTVLSTEHLLSSITSYYILNQESDEVILDVKIDTNKNIIVSGLVALDNFTLHLTGIKS